jgi:hypothetical protein
MNDDNRFELIQSLDWLYLAATTSNDTARIALAARLGLDCPGSVGAATAERRVA